MSFCLFFLSPLVKQWNYMLCLWLQIHWCQLRTEVMLSLWIKQLMLPLLEPNICINLEYYSFPTTLINLFLIFITMNLSVFAFPDGQFCSSLLLKYLVFTFYLYSFDPHLFNRQKSFFSTHSLFLCITAEHFIPYLRILFP